MSEKVKIDLQEKKTEFEWLSTQDRFWLTVTPRLFEWLRMVAVLAAVSWVSRKSNSWPLKLLVAICYASMFCYFQAFFYQLEFRGFPWVKRPGLERLLSIALSGTLGIVAYWLIYQSVGAIIDAHP
jgi:hypothetical protein